MERKSLFLIGVGVIGLSVFLFLLLLTSNKIINEHPPQYPESNLTLKYQAVNTSSSSSEHHLENSCLLSNGTLVVCKNNQECINNKCTLKYQTGKYGVIYVYESDLTHNPDWRKYLERDLEKTQKSLLELTNNKLNYSFDILGEVYTKELCWNPAILGIRYKTIIKEVDLSNNNTIFITPFNTTSQIPGSSFGSHTLVIDSTKRKVIKEDKEYLISTDYVDMKIDCPKCKVYYEDRTNIFQKKFPNQDYIEVNTTYVEIDCDNNLVNLKFNQQLLNNIKEVASQKLNFDLNNYEDIILIFGNFGRILPYESEDNLMYRCTTSEGFIGGYSNLIFAENEIKSGGLIDCVSPGYSGGVFYDSLGWHMLVHEFLHPLGAVDIYDTGTILGYDSPAYYRSKALEADPLADESIMGNSDRICKQETEKTKKGECTKKELERVYLDKYNKDIIGIY